MLSLGRKTNELLNKYFQTNNKKELSTEFLKWVAAEKTKHIKKSPLKKLTKTEKKQDKITAKKQKEAIKKVEEEVLQKVIKVRAEKKEEAKKLAIEKAAYVYQINDRVRLIDGTSVGTIDKIEKKTVFINYGVFTTKAKLTQLELVEKSKKKK